MSSRKDATQTGTRRFSPTHLDALWLACGALAFAILLLSQIIAPLKGLTGDEPHYVVVTHSIVSDFDFDLADDYNVEQAWQDFYAGELGPHYAPGLKGRHSTRNIGLSVYLVPFYLIGKLFGAVPFWCRLGMALLYAAVVGITYLLLRDLNISRTPALIASALSAVTVPLAFYSYSIFPEVPAALLCIVSLRAMLTWDQRSALPPLIAGICLALLPWLGIKFAVLSVVFGIGYLLMILRGKAPLMRSIAALASGPAVALLILLWFLWSLYGSVNPSVIYTGVGEGAKPLGGFNMQAYGEHTPGFAAGFLRVFLLYLFDQRDGLLFYSPVYLVGIAGLILAFGKLNASRLMTIAFAAYWLSYAASGWYSGFAPPARPLLAVIWILVVGIAFAFERLRGTLARTAIYATAAISLCFTILYVFHNHLIYHDVGANSQAYGNNFISSIISPFDLTTLFPNLINPFDINPLATVFILTLAIAIILLLVRESKNTPRKTPQANYGLLLTATAVPVLFFAIGYLNTVIIPPETMQGKGALRLVFPDENTYGFEPVHKDGQDHRGFWQKGGSKATVYAVSHDMPDTLIIEARSLVPQKILLEIEGSAHELDFGGTGRKPGWLRVEIPGELAARWRHRALFRINISTPSGRSPDEENTEDTRYLGCQVAVYRSSGS